jgi:hypothetical protein
MKWNSEACILLFFTRDWDFRMGFSSIYTEGFRTMINFSDKTYRHFLSETTFRRMEPVCALRNKARSIELAPISGSN